MPEIIKDSLMVALVVAGVVIAIRGFLEVNIWMVIIGALNLAGAGLLALWGLEEENKDVSK